jgi:hypothetical protein
MLKTITIILLALSIASLSRCSESSAKITATEDTAFLTPVPQETLLAYRYDTPITNKLQAVISARANLLSTRLHYDTPPGIVSVEKLNLESALKKLERPGVYDYDDRPGDTVVWLVIFEGEWQIIPPDPLHTYTPSAPSHRCVFALVDALDAGRSRIGTIDCAR